MSSSRQDQVGNRHELSPLRVARRFRAQPTGR